MVGCVREGYVIEEVRVPLKGVVKRPCTDVPVQNKMNGVVGRSHVVREARVTGGNVSLETVRFTVVRDGGGRGTGIRFRRVSCPLGECGTR